jgi:3-deoxy-D-manno-octulosonic-acid transferase
LNPDRTRGVTPLDAGFPMLKRIYNALWYPALPFALVAAGGRDQRNRRERLGRAITGSSRDRADSVRVWVHVSSVGEVEAVRPVVLGLTREMPGAAISITTMTVAGREAARRRIPGIAACQLAPLDYRTSVRAFIARVRPHLVLIAETELWPNFFSESARAGARVAIINGRLSERSLARYRLIRPLMEKTLAHADLILTQSPADADRFIALGALRSRVFVTGNTKFETDAATDSALRPALRNFAAGRPLLIAGSTAPGEERMVLNAWRNLADRFDGLELAIAPRHLERVREIEEELRAGGVSWIRASSLTNSSATGSDRKVLLLDTMGELAALYSRAAVAFVGGSMDPPRGGQNLAEPAAWAVPVLFGPHYENQQTIGDALIEGGGGRVVVDAAQLESTVAEWLTDDAVRRAAGDRARRVLGHLAGAGLSTLQHLKSLLKPPAQ